MKIQIFVSSKKLEKFYQEAIAEYKKRLSRYCKISLTICKTPKALLNKIPNHSYIICVNTQENSIPSETLAEKIKAYGLTGNSNISIIVNYPLENFDEEWTISKLEMNEGLTTTILFEQIYRAYRIINNQAYHK